MMPTAVVAARRSRPASPTYLQVISHGVAQHPPGHADGLSSS